MLTEERTFYKGYVAGVVLPNQCRSFSEDDGLLGLLSGQ